MSTYTIVVEPDAPGKLTEFAIRWMEVTNWPHSLPARLSRKNVGGVPTTTNDRGGAAGWARQGLGGKG